MSAEIEIQTAYPIPELSDFIESFWMINNKSDKAHELVIMPDGRFDVIYSFSEIEPFNCMQMGLSIHPEQNSIPPKGVMFAVSFKLLSIEYLFNQKAGNILNSAQPLPPHFWGIKKSDLYNFQGFCDKLTTQIQELINPDIDSRKRKLFTLIYGSNGNLSVKELSEQVFWSSRQINRYFNDQFGLSLKAFCNILKFNTSLQQIKEGRFFPEQNFTDQAHFIKVVKKFSGAVPRELFKNKNDRFLQLLALHKK